MRALVLAAAAVLAAAMVGAEAQARPGAWWDALGVRDLSGAALSPSCRWIVVVALGQECPVSNASLPELNRIAAEFRGQGVALVGAYVDPNAGLAELRAHAADYAVKFSLADDRSQRLAKDVGATYTPEAAVLTASGERLYLGAIDDRVGPGGEEKPSATHPYLREVLKALVAGGKGPFAAHPGYGCSLPEAVRK